MGPKFPLKIGQKSTKIRLFSKYSHFWSKNFKKIKFLTTKKAFLVPLSVVFLFKIAFYVEWYNFQIDWTYSGFCPPILGQVRPKKPKICFLHFFDIFWILRKNRYFSGLKYKEDEKKDLSTSKFRLDETAPNRANQGRFFEL